MLLNWFDTKEAVFIGVKLADDLSKKLPKTNSKHAEKELASMAKVIQKVFSQLDQLKQNSSLNFYKKSKLINEFKWRLTEIGHDKAFVDSVTKELVLYIR